MSLEDSVRPRAAAPLPAHDEGMTERPVKIEVRDFNFYYSAFQALKNLQLV